MEGLPGRRVSGTTAEYWKCAEFLHHEADLLDNRQLDEWFNLLAPDLDYRIPVRFTVDHGASVGPFSSSGFHLLANWRSMKARIDRLRSDAAWSEHPPTRTRRLLTNIQVYATGQDGEFAVSSNFLFYRARAEGEAALLCGTRYDVLRAEDGALRLARRTVFLDQVSLPVECISIPL